MTIRIDENRENPLFIPAIEEVNRDRLQFIAQYCKSVLDVDADDVLSAGGAVVPDAAPGSEPFEVLLPAVPRILDFKYEPVEGMAYIRTTAGGLEPVYFKDDRQAEVVEGYWRSVSTAFKPLPLGLRKRLASTVVFKPEAESTTGCLVKLATLYKQLDEAIGLAASKRANGRRRILSAADQEQIGSFFVRYACRLNDILTRTINDLAVETIRNLANNSRVARLDVSEQEWMPLFVWADEAASVCREVAVAHIDGKEVVFVNNGLLEASLFPSLKDDDIDIARENAYEPRPPLSAQTAALRFYARATRSRPRPSTVMGFLDAIGELMRALEYVGRAELFACNKAEVDFFVGWCASQMHDEAESLTRLLFAETKTLFSD